MSEKYNIEKKWIKLKTAKYLDFFCKPEVILLTHAQYIWQENSARASCKSTLLRFFAYVKKLLFLDSI